MSPEKLTGLITRGIANVLTRYWEKLYLYERKDMTSVVNYITYFSRPKHAS